MALGEFFSQFRGLLFGSEDVLRNRRHQPRLAIELPVTVALEDRQVLPAQVCDFGANGLRLKLTTRLARGRKLHVQVMADSGLEGSPSLGCRVAWCKPEGSGFQIGCRYDDTPEVLATSWVQMLLIERHQRGQERRDRRVEATIPALLLNRDTPPQSVFVLDLSLGGARVFAAQAWSAQEAPRLSFGVPGKSQSVDFAVEVVEARALDTSGYSYRLRFLDTDARRLALLRRMLMQLLDGVRKAGRDRPSDLIPAPAAGAPRPSASAPEGKLGAAVQGPKDKPTRRKSGVSAYLRGPDLPPPRPQPPEPERPGTLPVDAQPTSRLQPAELPSDLPLPATRSERIACWEPPLRRIQTLLCPSEPRIRRRGWLSAALEGWFPRVELCGDSACRPTGDFLRCLGPALPGVLGLLNLMQWQIDTELEHGFVLGPGLLWSDRRNLTAWWLARRNLLGWVEQGLRTRERLERRPSSLRQKAYQLLSILGYGGSEAVRQMLVCSRVSTGIARHSGIVDPVLLDQLRLASLLKDIGEALLVIGSQSRAQRDRYLLHLNGLDHGEVELLDLVSDWSGFECPPDLQVNRLRIHGLTVEMLPCHPRVGDRLLGRLGFPAEVRTAVRHHHEAWSGVGHPEGLREAEIPWAARCLAVADGFASSMTYVNSPERAFAETAQLEGSFYDPALLTALRAYLREVGVLS